MSIPLTFVATLIIVFFAVAFSLQNDQVVSIQFFGWMFEWSLVLVLLTTLCLGILIQVLVSIPAHIRNTQRITHLNKRVMELEQPPMHADDAPLDNP